MKLACTDSAYRHPEVADAELAGGDLQESHKLQSVKFGAQCNARLESNWLLSVLRTLQAIEWCMLFLADVNGTWRLFDFNCLP